MALKRPAEVVETVADLANLHIGDGQVVHVLGYGAAGEIRGGAPWRYDVAASDNTLAGYVENGPGGTGRFKRLRDSDRILNVHDMGAKGDGSTDDYAVFAAAASEAQTNGGTIVMPSGTYLFSQPLVMDQANGKTVRFQGEGKDATVIQPHGSWSGDALIKLTGTSADRMIWCDFSDFYVNCLNGATRADYGIYGSHVEHCNFNRIRIYNAGIGNLWENYCWDMYHSQCSFAFSQKHGVMGARNDVGVFNHIVFHQCESFENEGCGFFFPNAGKNVFLNGCDPEANKIAGIYANGVFNLVLHGCYFEANAATGHTFTTQGVGSAITGGNVTVNADVIFNGTTATVTDDPHTDFDRQIRGGLIIHGGYTATLTNTPRQVAAVFGCDRVVIDGLAGNESTDSANNLVVTHGMHLTTLDMQVRSVADELQGNLDTPLNVINANEASGKTGVPQWRESTFAWDKKEIVEVDPAAMTIDLQGSTWENTGYQWRGFTPYRLYGEVTTDNARYDFDLAGFTQFRNKFICACVDWFPYSNYAAGYAVGGQIEVDFGAGTTLLSTSAFAQSKLADETETTGSITTGTSSLTVASATGFSPNEYILVNSGTASGEPLFAKVVSVSGTTVTLDKNATNTVTDATVIVLRPHQTFRTFQCGDEGIIRMFFHKALGATTDGAVVLRFQLIPIG